MSETDGTRTFERARLGRIVRWAGYGLSIVLGVTLWPFLFQKGAEFNSVNFGIALILTWFCLPVSYGITHLLSSLMMRLAAKFDPIPYDRMVKQIVLAANLGGLAALGSCGMIASGYEPPQPFFAIYDIDLSRR